MMQNTFFECSFLFSSAPQYLTTHQTTHKSKISRFYYRNITSVSNRKKLRNKTVSDPLSECIRGCSFALKKSLKNDFQDLIHAKNSEELG